MNFNSINITVLITGVICGIEIFNDEFYVYKQLDVWKNYDELAKYRK